MNLKPGIVIVSYNMAEAVQQWHRYIGLSVNWPIEYIAVDNGSELPLNLWIPEERILRLSQNLRTTAGVMAGVDYLYQKGCTHVWPISTSTLPPDETVWHTYDPVERMMQVFSAVEFACAVSPTFIGESKSWPHQLLLSNGNTNVQHHWLVGLFAMWEINFLMENVDRRLSWSWGVDFELSALCRVTNRMMYKHNKVMVQLREGIGYEMNRMTCTQYDREKYARAEMEKVLGDKYGENWKKIVIPEEHWGYIDQM